MVGGAAMLTTAVSRNYITYDELLNADSAEDMAIFPNTDTGN